MQGRSLTVMGVHVLPGLGRDAIERLRATLHNSEGGEATGPLDEREQEPERVAVG